MKKIKLFFIICLISVIGSLQSFAQQWKPFGVDTTFPRSIITLSEIAGVKASLAAGTNLSLYSSMYSDALQTIPANQVFSDKNTRSCIAKNCAFIYLLGVKPGGNTTVSLSPAEQTNFKTRAINLLTNINTYISQFDSDSPSNYIEWQWSSKQMINFLSAYDLLLGAGVTASQLAVAKDSLKHFVGNLYFQSTKIVSGADFYQGVKNNHALMTAAAIGMGAVILNDINDTGQYSPFNWINASMWNIFNVIFWDIRKQSIFGKYGGYAEGTYYMRYAFVNLLPFFKSFGKFLPDTSLNYSYNSINLKLRNPWYDTNYTKIYDWAYTVKYPDGRMPSIEDSYVYSCFPELAILRNQKYNWQIRFSQFDASQSNSLDQQLQFVTDMRANYIAANVTPSVPQDSLFTVMPDAGIAVFRSGSDSVSNYFALTGKHGSTLLAADAHNQADDGAFFMMVNGQNMALAPGYLAYDMRDSVAGAKTHNMLFVNGQATLQGSPGLTNGANCYLEKYFQSAVQNFVELRTNYQNTDINRKVMHVRNKYFLLIDHFYGKVPQSYQWTLNGYGLAGGNANTGIYYDLTFTNRSYWQKNNSVLFAHITSDAPMAFSKQTNYHELSYRVLNTHTTLQAFTSSVSNATFMSCLQGVKNISTDTVASNVLNISGTTALKYSDNGYTDIAVSKSNSNSVNILKTATGLSNDFTTDAHFFWTSEKAGNIVDLFMYKGTSLKQNNKTLLTTSYPMNIQYLQTGAKTFSGYCGDSGTVIFYTGEFTWKFEGENVQNLKYDTATLASTVHFGGAGKFSFVLDNSHLAVENIFTDKNTVSVYPNPASEKITVKFMNNFSQKIQLTLFDIRGKAILKQFEEHISNEILIDVSKVSNGIYFLRFTDSSGNESFPYKIFVNR